MQAAARRGQQVQTPTAAGMSSGSGGPPRPMATTSTPPRAASRACRRRASQPLTAVLPTRLPVPITASAGMAARRAKRCGWISVSAAT